MHTNPSGLIALSATERDVLHRYNEVWHIGGPVLSDMSDFDLSYLPKAPEGFAASANVQGARWLSFGDHIYGERERRHGGLLLSTTLGICPSALEQAVKDGIVSKEYRPGKQ